MSLLLTTNGRSKSRAKLRIKGWGNGTISLVRAAIHMVKNTAASRVTDATDLSCSVYHTQFDDTEESKVLKENKVLKRPGSRMQMEGLHQVHH